MGKIIYILLVFVFLLSIVNAEPPFISSQFTSNGIIVEHPQIEYIKTNADHTFSFHLYNQTDGKPFNNISSISCSFHLYDSLGSHLLEYENLKASSFDYDIDVDRGNFTSIGSYAYIFQCNETSIGGFYQSVVRANPQGKQYTSTDGLIYVIALSILFAIFILSLYGSFKIPFKNEANTEGTMYKINWKKYLKLFLFAVAYTSLLGLTFFVWNISIGILEFKELGDFFYVMFRILYILIFPVCASIIIIGLASYVADRKYEKLFKRGVGIR